MPRTCLTHALRMHVCRVSAMCLTQVSSRKKKLGIGTSHGVNRVGLTRGVDGKAFNIFSNGGSFALDFGDTQVPLGPKHP